ncbi:MAG: homoserine kinase [Burkholderiales bacterium]|nr:homoserine kinase [Burkholderiales bacterium]
MAVFTQVSNEQAKCLLNQYDLGEFKSIEGIVSGIENSNFYLETSKGRFVLTVFERLSEEQLPYYLQLTRHLYKKGLNVSGPIPAKNGSLKEHVNGKPCSIAPCIAGNFEPEPSAELCEQMGTFLAKMHLAVKDFPYFQENQKGLDFWKESCPLVLPFMAEESAKLLQEEVFRMERLFATDEYNALETGAVHADLFRNNALVSTKDGRQKLEGVIDFYFACNAPFLFDLAVTMNDWCVDLETGEFVPEKAKAFLRGYNSIRPLSEHEREMWQDMLCAGALRFWMSRLYDYWLPRQASLLKPHDPGQFERILLKRKNAKAVELPWIY